MTKNMYGINNESNSVVRMYVTTSVTHKPEVRVEMLTFMQIVNNFGLEPYVCVSKRPIVPGVIDFPKFSYEDMEEIVAGGQGSFGVYW